MAIDEPIEITLYPAVGHAPPPVLDPEAGLFGRLCGACGCATTARRPSAPFHDRARRSRCSCVYHDPALAPVLPHSVGLQRGLTGVVHLFATHSQDGQNAIVTAHELLHTFGASDKYADRDTPLYPERLRRAAARAALSATLRRDHGRPRAAEPGSPGDARRPVADARRSGERARDRLDQALMDAALLLARPDWA